MLRHTCYAILTTFSKAGASPLRGAHSVDEELVALGGLADGPLIYVLTRNSHAREIRAFLEARGLPLAGVHVAPKGSSKGAFLEATLRDGELGLLVDDSAQELADPRVARCAAVVRMLFRRGAV